MAFTIYVTRDYEQMSQVAAGILLPQIIGATCSGKAFTLGNATGRSPEGLESILVAKQNEFNASNLRLFWLDEYVGLPGKTPDERRMHPESYWTHAHTHLIDKLPSTLGASVPPGSEIDVNLLTVALDAEKEHIQYQGTDHGKAVIISPDTKSQYLRGVYDLMNGYIQNIESAGGIDYWIVGIGGNGHLGFSEKGIPLGHNILLVKLDEITRNNAVKDGHLKTIGEGPKYAISMGVGGITKYARNILLLGSGERKTQPIFDSVLGPVSEDCPASDLQRYAENRDVIYVVDEPAARGILGKNEELEKKGIYIKDLRS